MQIGQRLLKQHMIMISAGNVARAAGAGAATIDGRMHCLDNRGVLAHAEVVVIGNADPEFKEVPDNLGPGQVLIDFVRIQDRQSEPGVYEGICW